LVVALFGCSSSDSFRWLGFLQQPGAKHCDSFSGRLTAHSRVSLVVDDVGHLVVSTCQIIWRKEMMEILVYAW